MKKYIYITLISSFYSITSCAQSKFTEGVVKVKNNSFEVNKSTMVFNDKKPLFVHSVKNKYNGPIPAPRDNYQFRILKSDIHVDLDMVKAIVYEDLKDKKENLRKKNEALGIRFIFETNGKISDINFTLAEGSIITPNEIAQIDEALRNKILAHFTGVDYKYYEAVNYSFPSITF